MQPETALELRVQRLVPEAVLPQRQTDGAAGYDLCAARNWIVPVRGRSLVPTGLAIAVPPGHYGRIAPRSGLAWHKGIAVGAGVIDADYRGQVSVLLFNHGNDAVQLAAGDRIAQLIIERIATPAVVEVAALDATPRGAGGFGSTGTAAPGEH